MSETYSIIIPRVFRRRMSHQRSSEGLEDQRLAAYPRYVQYCQQRFLQLVSYDQHYVLYLIFNSQHTHAMLEWRHVCIPKLIQTASAFDRKEVIISL